MGGGVKMFEISGAGTSDKPLMMRLTSLCKDKVLQRNTRHIEKGDNSASMVGRTGSVDVRLAGVGVSLSKSKAIVESNKNRRTLLNNKALRCSSWKRTTLSSVNLKIVAGPGQPFLSHQK